MIFAKKVPDDTYPNKALHHRAACLNAASLLQTEKPVVFKTTFLNPWRGNVRVQYLGRHRGCSLAILQINLEPNHSIFKELFVVSPKDDGKLFDK